VFPGYVTGERKRAFFALADLYVFPSRHESYGLTLLEALSAGLPAYAWTITVPGSVMKDEFGAIVRPADLLAAIRRCSPMKPGRVRMVKPPGPSQKRTLLRPAAKLAELLTS